MIIGEGFLLESYLASNFAALGSVLCERVDVGVPVFHLRDQGAERLSCKRPCQVSSENPITWFSMFVLPSLCIIVLLGSKPL